RRASLLFLAPYLWMQLRVCYSNLEQDARYPFSYTKHFAQLLPHGARVISDREPFGTSIAYWRRDIVMRSPAHHGRYYSFVKWDRAGFPMSELEMARDECGKSPTATVYFFGSTGNVPRACVSSLYAPYEGVTARTDEYDPGSVVSCKCLVH
ncbi:MAG TPA: hypothetical protein VGH87_24525, partial [Polyangiaceae bacterium]